MSQVVGLPNNSYKPITNMAWVRARLCNLQKRVHPTRRASDKVYQLLAHGRWFSPGTPASSTTKTGRHDIAEILLKVALKQNKSNQIKKSKDSVKLKCRLKFRRSMVFSGFLQQYKTYLHDITEILLKLSGVKHHNHAPSNSVSPGS